MADRRIEREGLCRSAPFTVRAADPTTRSDGLTIDGYAAVYDTPTRIDSWEGTFWEQIAFGAFRKSISERMPKLQFDHGYHPLIGSLPIGNWESMTEERNAGLRAIGRLLDNWLVEPVRDAIANDAVDGMSFRFSVVREDWYEAVENPDGTVTAGDPIPADEVVARLWTDSDDLLRILKELKASEAGPVVWPAYDATSVGVRSKVTIDLSRLSDPGERSKLAEAVFLADAATRTKDAPPSDQSSQRGHPSTDAPPAGSASPGEHPSPARAPANPKERADSIRARYREKLDRVLALSTSSDNKEGSAA